MPAALVRTFGCRCMHSLAHAKFLGYRDAEQCTKGAHHGNWRRICALFGSSQAAVPLLLLLPLPAEQSTEISRVVLALLLLLENAPTRPPWLCSLGQAFFIAAAAGEALRAQPFSQAQQHNRMMLQQWQQQCRRRRCCCCANACERHRRLTAPLDWWHKMNSIILCTNQSHSWQCFCGPT